MTSALMLELAKLFQTEAHRLRAEAWAIEHAAVRAAYERAS